MNVVPPYREFRVGEVLDSIWYPVESAVFDAFPPTIVWDNQELLKKDAFHFTVVHVATVCQLLMEATGIVRSTAEQKIMDFFNTFVDKRPIRLAALVDDFRYAQKDTKRTIVLRCVASNITDFFSELNRVFTIDMLPQPTHITLYTLQKNVGIHIPSDAVMESLPKVSIPTLQDALRRTLSDA